MTTSLRSLLRESVVRVSKGDTNTAKYEAEHIREALKAKGLDSGCHVGRSDLDSNPELVVEWYAGQFLDIVDTEAWFAMNGLINCLDKFCPEV